MLHGLERGDDRALHRTRVATRRLRELRPVLQMESDTAAKISRRLKKATQRLGPAREADVLRQLVNELGVSDRYSRTALNLIGAAVEKERKAERRRALKDVANLKRLSDKLARVASEQASKRDERREPVHRTGREWRWAIEARVAKRAARLRGAVETAGAVYLPERLHEVRIALKKLRYALESAQESGSPSARADLRALRARQDGLGRLHDLQRLIDRTRQVQASLTPPSLLVWRGLEDVVDGLEDECRRLHGRYMRHREALLALCTRQSGRSRSHAGPRRVTA
jgi:CHAD domain-containing protein